MRGCQGYMAAKEAKGIATGGCNWPQLKSSPSPADSASLPDGPFSPTHARHVTGAVAGQRRVIGDLHPKLGQDTNIIEHQSLFKGLANLHTPTDSVAVKI